MGLIQNKVDTQNTEINKNSSFTIGKVVGSSAKRSLSHLNYSFFFNGKIYNSFTNDYKGHPSEYIDKYYEVEFSSKDPNLSRVLLKKQIKDTLKIKTAGF